MENSTYRGNARLNAAGCYECAVCGATEAPPVMPVPLREFTASLERFVGEHIGCGTAPRQPHDLAALKGGRQP